MATGHTNTNKQVLSKLNEVLSTQQTTNNRVTEVNSNVNNINSSLPSIINSMGTINNTLSPMSSTLNTINSNTSHLSTMVSQIKAYTDQPTTRQYIPNTSMKFCGLHPSLASVLPSSPSIYRPIGAIYNDELHIVSDNYHVKWSSSTGWTTLSEKSAYGYYDVSGACMVLYNNELHLLGGAATQTGTKHYRWNGSSWNVVSTLPFPFAYGGCVVYRNEIHILGSYTDGYSTCHYKWNGSVWSSVSTLPQEFCDGSAVVYNDEIHLLGNNATNSKGYHYSQYTHYKWSPNFGWWDDTVLPIDLYDGGAVVLNNEIYIVGGYIRDSDASDANYNIYSWSGHEWTRVGTSPYQFDNGVMITYNGTIYMIGGNGNRNAHFQLRPLYKTTMYLKNNTFVTGNQLSIKGLNDAIYLVQFGSSYRIQYDGVYDISASSGIMLT